ncbi:MAG: hypothetical protein KDB00_24365 [Planctomycetales bacterium]|nr:hypothetical protein [Planctomycetales bacterium]
MDVDGTLLTGKFSAFGFQDGGGTSSTDAFDMRLAVTGGLLATAGTLSGGAPRPAYFAGSDIGLKITSEFSTFNNDFASSFSGGLKATLGPIEPDDNEPIPVNLGDYVWYDDNVNGIQDNGELGVEGVTVNLYVDANNNGIAEPNGADGGPIATDVTDSNGLYLFEGLYPGEYFVEFVTSTLPAGYALTGQNAGTDDAVDSDADQSTGLTEIISLGVVDDLTWDAGIYQLPVPAIDIEKLVRVFRETDIHLEKTVVGDDKTGDDKTGDDTTGDDKTGDDKTGDDKWGDFEHYLWSFAGDDKYGDDKYGDDKSDGDGGDDKTGDDKDGSGSSHFVVGDEVTFNYEVTTTGTVELSNVSIIDDNGTPDDGSDDFVPTPVTSAGFNVGDTDQDGKLDPGEAWLFMAVDAVQEGCYHNIAVAAGDDETGVTYLDADDASYVGVVPVTDTGDDSSCDDDKTGDDKTGDDKSDWNWDGFWYHFHTWATTDDKAGSDDKTESWTSFRTHISSWMYGDDKSGDDSYGGDDKTGGDSYGGDDKTGDDKTGDDKTGDDKTGDDKDCVGHDGDATISDIIKQSIMDQRMGVDADDPTGPVGATGDMVKFTFVVTNPGDVDLTNVVVVDDNATPLDNADDFNPTPMLDVNGFNVGDVNHDGALNPGEEWLYMAMGLVAPGQHTNLATVTGQDGDGNSVTDDDPANWYGLTNPGIEIEKTVVVPVGDDKTGDDKTGDDKTGDDDKSDCWHSFWGNVDSHYGDDKYTSPYSWSGYSWWGYGDDKSGDDKTGDGTTGDDKTGDDKTGDDKASFDVGDDIVFRYTVRNTGDVPLENVVVVDDNATPADNSDDLVALAVDANMDGFNDGDLNMNNLLDLDEEWYFEAAIVADQVGEFNNIADVVGTAAVGTPTTVTDADDATYWVNDKDDKVHIEAEDCTDKDSPWWGYSKNDGTDDKYMKTYNGSGSYYNAPPSGRGMRYSFNLDHSGQFKISGLVKAPSDSDNSFWVKVDDGNWVQWHTDVTGSQWEMQDVTHGWDKDQVKFNLGAGNHTIQIKVREDGTMIDKIEVTPIVTTTSTIFIDAADYSSLSGWWEVQVDENGNEFLTTDDHGNAYYNWVPWGQTASYTFNVDEDGDYRIFGLVNAESLSSNSFWIAVDGGEWIEWHLNVTADGAFEWQAVTDGFAQSDVLFNLDAGAHTIKIKVREDGTSFSKLAITNDLTIDAADLVDLA